MVGEAAPRPQVFALRRKRCQQVQGSTKKSSSSYLHCTSVIASWICSVSFSISSMHPLLLLLLPFHNNSSSFMIGIMKLLFYIIFSLAFVHPSVCLHCDQDTDDCGILGKLRYPFWRIDQPDYCGLPGFGILCQMYDTKFKSGTLYRILQLDQQKKIMRIVNPYFLEANGCPWTSLQTTTPDFKLFKYTERVVNITLFSDMSILLLNNPLFKKFSCRILHGVSRDGYYAETGSLIRIPHQNLPTSENVTVPVMKALFDGMMRGDNDLQTALVSGFEVSYDVAADISTCKECEKSGGDCGYDTGLKQTTCFCPHGSNITMSSRNGTTQRCPGGGHLEKKILIGTTGAVSSILVLLLVVLLIFLKRKQRERRNDQHILEAFYNNQGSLALKRYKYFDVKKMTNSFKEKLGQGGYGSVFKGKLHDGHLVAVKLLFTNSKNNGEEFINEVESISRTSHVNVVNLLGFCLEGKKRALIYEFMTNGSLEKFIYNKMSAVTLGDHHPQLGGDTLYQIAIGIAHGLEYLHRGCNTRILHFDIKPHNILLDEKFCPKIADFGLAKLCTRNESMISFLGTRGTAGYIAPEVFSRNFGGVSYKSDVYSYGMMILEMVGGRKNIDVGVGMDHSSQLYYPHWIYERLKQNEDLGLHGSLMTEASEEIARKMIIVGLWCIQANPTNRPSMTTVLEMLEGRSETLQIPPKPFFSSP